ncbi:MAG: lipid-A-disaccharide synthase [Bacteroidota bacterium]
MIERVMMVAGEASGDLQGSGVVRELKARMPTIDVFGVGGENMRREGMELVYHVKELSVMGFLEVLSKLPLLRSVQKTLAGLLRYRRPDLVVLIDFPGFNLRLARSVKQHSIPVLYYISPQVWAWGKRRLSAMKGVVDKMLVVFPFEQRIYEQAGIPVEFVGHPLLDAIEQDEKNNLDRAGFCRRYGFDASRRILGLFPGSREVEIRNHLSVMVRTALLLREKHDLEVGVGLAATVSPSLYEDLLGDEGEVRLVEGNTYGLMRHSHVAAVASGTATVETACFGTPFVVVFRTSWLSYLIARLLVRVKTIGMVNILAGRKIVPELVQGKLYVDNLLRELETYLTDAAVRERVKGELMRVRGMLGSSGASGRVAKTILQWNDYQT